MCGIIGYVGEHDADPICRDALHLLEYRGYDSAGIAVAGYRHRAVGTVDDLPAERLDGSVGIGHTRWATHGDVTVENAHPHTDPDHEWFVAHNGIIENADALRAALDGPFESDTDSEVIPHLLADRGVSRTVDALDGQYAFVAHRAGEAELHAVRQHSPLVVGRADHGTFVASDVPALRGLADEVAYLETGDVVTLMPHGWLVSNASGEVSREPVALADGADRPDKGGHAHWTIKEIFEQPYALDRTPSPAPERELSPGLTTKIGTIDPARRLHLIGSGSSAFAAEFGAILARAQGIDATAFVASEYERAALSPSPHTTIAVSQSGETADVLSALRRTSPAHVVAVTNGPGSSLCQQADVTIDVNAGPEIGVAATKTWTATIQTLASMVGSEIAAAVGDCRNALDDTDGCYRMAEAFRSATPIIVLGSGPFLPVAREAALKLQELAYAPAWAFPAHELKHGPLALVDDDTLVIGCEDYSTALSEATARGASIHTLDRYGVMGTVTWCYLFAYHLARIHGRAIDQPRNLAKSVTVE